MASTRGRAPRQRAALEPVRSESRRLAQARHGPHACRYLSDPPRPKMPAARSVLPLSFARLPLAQVRPGTAHYFKPCRIAAHPRRRTCRTCVPPITISCPQSIHEHPPSSGGVNWLATDQHPTGHVVTRRSFRSLRNNPHTVSDRTRNRCAQPTAYWAIRKALGRISTAGSQSPNLKRTAPFRSGLVRSLGSSVGIRLGKARVLGPARVARAPAARVPAQVGPEPAFRLMP